MRDIALVVGTIIILIVLLGAGPFLTLFSLNTLFNLGIAYNLQTWIATYFLVGVVTGKSLLKKIIQLSAIGYIINRVKNWSK